MRITDISGQQTPYDDVYKEEIFIAWYKTGRPNGIKLLDAIPSDRGGRKPTLQALSMWRSTLSWDTRADVLDTEVARQIEKRAIEEKVEMFNRHAALGRDLQDQGLEFLKTHEIEKDATALKMIIAGVEMEKASRGLPDALAKIAELQDDDLKGLVGKLLQHYDPNSTNIDIAAIEKINGEIIEGNFEEAEDAGE